MGTPRRWNEENTVEHPIIEWLLTPELGWRFKDQAAVSRLYRTDEVEVLLLPILRQKLKDVNPGVITDDARADVILTKLRAIRDNAEWISWLRNEATYQFSADEKAQPHQSDRLRRSDEQRLSMRRISSGWMAATIVFGQMCCSSLTAFRS